MSKFEQINTPKEVADVAVGATLMMAGPDVARSAFEAYSIDFLPDSEVIADAFEAGVDLTQSAVPIAAAAMIMYAGFKKMTAGFKKN